MIGGTGMIKPEGTLDIDFKRLTPELCGDYLYYFENTAFTDHEEWADCYCLESHLSQEENEEIWEERQSRRAKAQELIEQGIMQGYLIYDGDNIIGWCNTGDKKSFLPVMNDPEHQTVDLNRTKVKIIYCIEIAPDYRGKGIAHRIIERVCEDAKKEGYTFVEAYPFLDMDFKYQYHGPVRLYESHGFSRIADKSWFCIMSRIL